MAFPIAFAPAQWARGTHAILAAAALTILGPTGAGAQQPAAPAPKLAQAKQPAQPKQPSPAPQAAQPPQGAAQQPKLEYTQWTKVCFKESQAADAKQICRTQRDARLDNGQPMVSVVVIEREGDARKMIQILVPPGLLIQPGTGLSIDQGQAEAGAFEICLPHMCMAQIEVSVDYLARLKRGQQVAVLAYNAQGQQVSFPVPLAEFAKVNEGPATDPKVLEEQQKKLQEELQKRAEEARKNLQNQPTPR